MQTSDSSRRFGRLGAILAAAVAGALLVILTEAPAGFLAIAVKSWSHGRVELGDASGTVWSGQASVILTPGDRDPAKRTRVPGLTAWHIEPGRLLFGSLDLTLSNAAVLDAPLSLRLDRARNATVTANRLHLPAGVLVGLGAPWNTIRPGGEITLEWDTLRLASMTLHGELRGEWIDASSTLSPIVPFGRYRVVADGVYPGARVHLETISGPMQMTGDGTIADGNHLRFQGTAQVQPGTDQSVATQLSGLISLLGPRDGDGAILNFGL